MRLYHFSEEPGIREFVPRTPRRHPHAEPLVYAIEEEFAPLYFFPRACPRIAVWPTPDTTLHDRAEFDARAAGHRLVMWIDRAWESAWRQGSLYRYTFAPDDFAATGDHGVWVARRPVVPLGVEHFTGLPDRAKAAGAPVQVTALIDQAKALYDFRTRQFRTSLHVSMIRCGDLPGWPGDGGQAVAVRS